MLKRELKINFKNFAIWLLILLALLLVVFLIYPSIINSENVKMLDEMMKMYPEELLKAFNMDITSIDSVFGWLKTEGFTSILLITGFYSATLGSSILLKEENDKTIEYLNSLPIKRNNVIFNKIICGFVYIFLMVFIIGVFNYIGLLLSGEFDQKLYVLLSITPLFSSFVIFSLCLFISTFTNKTRKMIGISLCIVFISYFLQIISELSDKVEFFKYISIFTLADIRNVITNGSINSIIMGISIALTLLFVGLTFVKYNKKDFV